MTSANTLAEGSLRYLAIGELKANTYNPNQMNEEMFEKELASIRTFGFVDPITVRSFSDGLWEIIDGEHRWRAAQQLGLTTVPVFDLGEIDDSIARQLTIVLNETRGQANPEKLGQLLKDLMARETKDSLLSTLPFSREAFDRLTGLPALNWDDLDVRRPQMSGERPSAWVERTYRMPKESAEVIDRAIERARDRADGDLSEWNALELIAADFLSS